MSRASSSGREPEPRRRAERAGRRLSDAVTAACALAYPRIRVHDGRVVRDCAREAIAAEGLAALPREAAALAIAGVRARAGLVGRELLQAPWRAALQQLTLPLATALLLMWTFAFVPRYDHWPLGEGWALLLGGSFAAVVGAALRSRLLTAGGAGAVFVAAAAPYLGYGVDPLSISLGPSFFRGWQLDYAVASLAPTLLLVAGGLALPRGDHPPLPTALARLIAAVAPALVAAVLLAPLAEPRATHGLMHIDPDRPPVPFVGAPYEWPWLPPSRHLVPIFGLALLAGLLVAWLQRRRRPERLLAIAVLLISIAYPLAWVATRTESLNVPWWMLNSPYPLVLTAIPLLFALILLRRAIRTPQQ